MSEQTQSTYKLLKAKSLIEECDCCGCWLDRFPAFLGWEPESGEGCDCGCTSVKFREGRAYGPRSKQRAEIEKAFNELHQHIDDPEDVITEPPFRSIVAMDDTSWDDPQGSINRIINNW